MRPAQKAPENILADFQDYCVENASMRPAQKAPENTGDWFQLYSADGASMRPAQKAPENTSAPTTSNSSGGSFNEAGAKSAGKPSGGVSKSRR